MAKLVKNNKKDKNKTHMLTTIFTLVVSCVFCIVLVLGVENYYKEPVKNDNKLIRSLYDDESINVTIKFNKINTSTEDYYLLKTNSDKHIVSKESEKVQVDTQIIIDETIYADETPNTPDDSDTDTDINEVMYASEPIYFQDKILTRYINNKGEMIVLASTFDGNNVKTFDRSELKKAFDIKPRKPEFNTDNTVVGLYGHKNEENYVAEIANIFVEALKNNSETMDSDFKKNAIKYFTLNGYNTFIDTQSDFTMLNSVNIDVNIACAGKSKIDIDTKDRLFIQLKINIDNEDVLTNIIVKLDDNHRVYDIDII